MRPSFLGHVLNGITLFIAIIYFYIQRDKLSTENIIIIITLLSIAIGIHSMLHHVEEIVYGFNPLEGQYNFRKIQ
jgi:hypothetical protein